MKIYTAIFMGIIMGIIILYDVYAVLNGGIESSISFLLIGWSYEYPSFTFLMGFTMGHLFWKIRAVKKDI